MKAKCVGGVLNGQEVEIQGERMKAPRLIRLDDVSNALKPAPAVEYRYEFDLYELEHIGPNDWRYRLSTR